MSPPPPEPQGNDRLCGDGSAQPRFAAQFGGSGQVLPGSQVLVENGYDFLVVDGQCQFWVQKEDLGDVRTGTLSEVEATELYRALRLAQWPEYVGSYSQPLCDGPSWRYRFGTELVRVSSGCDAADTVERVQWLRDEVRATIESLHAQGTPVDGTVRFVLVARPEADESYLQYQNPPRWPLTTPAASLAVTEAEGYGDVTSHLAAGAEADELRAIAVRFRNGEIGSDWAGFIPVKDADGILYALFVRDTIPFEDDQGLWQ